jgi:hypothetical protein
MNFRIRSQNRNPVVIFKSDDNIEDITDITKLVAELEKNLISQPMTENNNNIITNTLNDVVTPELKSNNYRQKTILYNPEKIITEEDGTCLISFPFNGLLYKLDNIVFSANIQSESEFILSDKETGIVYCVKKIINYTDTNLTWIWQDFTNIPEKICTLDIIVECKKRKNLEIFAVEINMTEKN